MGENEYEKKIKIMREHLEKNVFNSSELKKKSIKEIGKRKFIRLGSWSY
jgi:hypothetical protein